MHQSRPVQHHLADFAEIAELDEPEMLELASLASMHFEPMSERYVVIVRSHDPVTGEHTVSRTSVARRA